MLHPLELIYHFDFFNFKLYFKFVVKVSINLGIEFPLPLRRHFQ